MAIRAALGASASDIRGLVLGHGLWLATAGVAAGVLLFFAASPLLKWQLYQVGAVDPLSIAGVIGAVLLVGIAASVAPSLRASRSTPMQLLRED
jgi:ABC-type antimicrobial peptide transport system permease subunit